MSPTIKVIFFLVATTQAIHVSDICREMDLALDFLLQNTDSVDIDAYAGVVWTQAHLKSVLQQKVVPRVKIKLEKLTDKTDIIIQATKDQVKVNNKNFENFTENVLKPSKWSRQLTFGLKKLGNTSIYANIVPKKYESYMHYINKNNITEEFTDSCFLELTVAASDKEDCTISQKCRNFLLDDTYMDPMYGTPTRLLYLQVARLQNCQIEKKYYERQAKMYCNYMLAEAKGNMQLGFIPALDDLLLEQIAFCGYEGFSEYFTEKFVGHVFDMPRKDGCFENSDFSLETLSEPAPLGTGNATMHGCSARTTGLGTTALAIILRNVLYKKGLKASS